MDKYDVAIVGAGIIGSAIAREIAQYQLNVIVFEKEPDVACGTSKANSGIVHAGYDAKKGSLKAKYNVSGQKLFEQLSMELDFPFKRCGSMVVAFDEDGMKTLKALEQNGINNGLTDLEILTGDEARVLEPNLNETIYGVLNVPSGGIVCPYEMTIAYAENAVENGVIFKLNCMVNDIKKENDFFILQTSEAVYKSKVVINAAGVHGDEIHNMVHKEKIKLQSRKGEYCLFDRSENGFVTRTIFQLPSKMGKGVLVTPTVDGNLLVGPTSVDIDQKEDVDTTTEGLKSVLETGVKSVNKLPMNKIITSFAGLRAHLPGDDFMIGQSEEVPGFIFVTGIESPGLSSAPAIARAIEEIIVTILKPHKKEDFQPIRKAPPRFRHLSNEKRRELIKNNPDYGNIICRCETITKGEIVDALRSPLKIKDIDAIKRRTRTGMGRCQAGFCSMRIVDIIAEELQIEVTEVTKKGKNTQILIEKNKASLSSGV